MSRLENFLQCHGKNDKKTFDNPFETLKKEINQRAKSDEELLNDLEESDKFLSDILDRYKDSKSKPAYINEKIIRVVTERLLAIKHEKQKVIEGSRLSRLVKELTIDINMADKALTLNINNKSDRQNFYNKIASMIETTLEKHSAFREHPVYEVLEKRLDKINALKEGYKIIDERIESNEIS